MGREIELKIAVPSLPPEREKIIAAGGREIESVLETNLFFDQAGDLLGQRRSALRVRLFERNGQRDKAGLLTYKADARQGAMHNRQSFDVTIDPANEFLELLAATGFQQKLGFEKRRQSWALGACRVELDELPGQLGTYVEIEGPHEQAVTQVQRQLGLEGRENHQQTYLRMVKEYLQAHPQPENLLRFA